MVGWDRQKEPRLQTAGVANNLVNFLKRVHQQRIILCQLVSKSVSLVRVKFEVCIYAKLLDLRWTNRWQWRLVRRKPGISYCHTSNAGILPYYNTTYCHITILPYWLSTILPYYHAGILPFYILPYNCTALHISILPIVYCHTAFLPYCLLTCCHIILLPYCHTAKPNWTYCSSPSLAGDAWDETPRAGAASLETNFCNEGWF